MNAPMSTERLAEIRASVAAAPHPAPGTWSRALRELLAEVERLRSLWSSVAVRQQMSIKGLQAEARGRAEYGARLRARVAALESERAERNVVLHDVQVENAKLRTRIAELRAVEFEEMRQALLAAGHPEVAHDWLDADPDTAFPLPGVAHPRVEEGAS